MPWLVAPSFEWLALQAGTESELKTSPPWGENPAPHGLNQPGDQPARRPTPRDRWTLANKRASAFGTCAPGVGSKVNADMVKALAAAQAAAAKGDMKAFTVARNKVQSLLATIFVQVRCRGRREPLEPSPPGLGGCRSRPALAK